jgi:hypothetical protein
VSLVLKDESTAMEFAFLDPLRRTISQVNDVRLAGRERDSRRQQFSE